MKHLSYSSAAAVAATFALASLARAADETPAPSKPARVEQHVRIVTSDDDAPEQPKEKVTFLGVEVMPASEAMSAQLGLKRGIGLVVGHVVPDSPAAPVLAKHDVLTKLNDQWLVEPHQLAVLVQSFDEGTEVGLTFLRAGKEQTARVKLVKHERPRLTFFTHRFPGAAWTSGDGDIMFNHLQEENRTPEARSEIERSLRLIPRELGRGSAHDLIVQAPGGAGTPRVSIMALPRAVLVYSDDAGAVELRHEEGRRLLEVRDKDNKVTFNGDVTSPELRAKLPADVRGRLEKVEAVDRLDVETPKEFETDERSLMPEAVPASKIMFPLRARERLFRPTAGEARQV